MGMLSDVRRVMKVGRRGGRREEEEDGEEGEGIESSVELNGGERRKDQLGFVREKTRLYTDRLTVD